MRKFTCIGGGSRKFWEIAEPEQVDSHKWAVRVRFGRIGQWGQERIHVESNKYAASSYYMDKIHEKRDKKGYKETGQSEIKKNVVTYTPDYVQEPKPKACAHDNLTRAGKTWKCGACKKEVDFGKDAAPVEAIGIEVVTQVRRFFALGDR